MALTLVECTMLIPGFVWLMSVCNCTFLLLPFFLNGAGHLLYIQCMSCLEEVGDNACSGKDVV